MSENNNDKRSRTGYIFHPSIQVKVVSKTLQLSLLAHVLVTVFSICFIFYIGLTSYLQEIPEFVSKQMPVFQMDLIFLLMILFILILIGIYTLVLSHRIAGPLFKMKMELENGNKTGNYGKIFLRKNSFHKDLTIAYNEMAEKLNKSKN